jgi:hypothetical protein
MGLAIEYIKTLIHVLKSSADEVLETLGVDDPDLACKKLEALALEDEYFKSRSLYPNVFSPGRALHAVYGKLLLDVYQVDCPVERNA